MTRQAMKRSLLLFIGLALLCGWFGVLVDSYLGEQPEENSLGMGLWLITPFLAGILLRAFTRQWKGFGGLPRFKNNGKWYLVAFLIYPLVTLLTLGMAWLAGGIESAPFDWSRFTSLALLMLGGSLIKNIFEEFSWRGYLTPMLLELKWKDWQVYLVSGLVWALWHAAYYLVFLPDRYFVSASRMEMVFIGCVIMTCWSIMYVEIYRLSRSVWPCVLMHAVEDALPTVLVAAGGFFTFAKGFELWLDPVSGIGATLLFVAIGLVLRALRIKKEQAPAERLNAKINT